MPASKLTLRDKQTLLETARHAIKYGLQYHKVPTLELEKYTPQLQNINASFVTLKEGNKLRGCYGRVEAFQPIIQDVAQHAFTAAFDDSRFSPVNHIEEPLIHISISLLSKSSEIVFDSEVDLIKQVLPNTDGLTLNYKNNAATLLPSVWLEIPKTENFIKLLKSEAGLAADFWHHQVRVFRFSCDTID
jgi:AmmeMemoRadiSam system protein A